MRPEDLFNELMSEFGAHLMQAQEAQQQLTDAQQQLGELSVDAKSHDGLIRVSVGPPGHVRKLELDPRVKRLDTETIAQQITELINTSSQLLQEEIAKVVQDMMPDVNVAEAVADFRRADEPPA